MDFPSHIALDLRVRARPRIPVQRTRGFQGKPAPLAGVGLRALQYARTQEVSLDVAARHFGCSRGAVRSAARRHAGLALAPLAVKAALAAEERGITCARAAAEVGVSVFEALAAFNVLYPSRQRQLVG